MAQAVSRRLPTAEAQPRSQISPVGFVADKVALGQVFLEPFGFPLSVSFHRCSIFIHVSPGGWTVGLLADAVPQRQ
jgi:hypothetical protein